MNSTYDLNLLVNSLIVNKMFYVNAKHKSAPIFFFFYHNFFMTT